MHQNQKISVEKLQLWKNNARYTHELSTEEECINELFRDSLMNRKQKMLLDDIFLKTEVIESCVVYKDIDKDKIQYITLDGNRRLSLFKIFEYPDLIKKYNLDLAKLNHINENIKFFDCIVYDDINEAYELVKLRHLDEQNGKGTVKWGSSNKERMLSIQGIDSKSIGFEILNFYKSTNKPEFLHVKSIIKDKSTLDRIFRYKDIYNGIFRLKSKYDYNLENYKHQIKINEILEKFYDEGGNVGIVYTADKCKNIFKDIEPLMENENQLSFSDILQDHDSQKIADQEKTIFPLKAHNSYVQGVENIFNWKSQSIKAHNNLFNYYLNKLVNINKNMNKNRDLLLDITPYFYRLLLDIAIRDISEFINKGLADKIVTVTFERKSFNTTASAVSLVNSNKISSIISICDNLRTNENKEIFSIYKAKLNYYHFTVKNNNSINKFVKDLNDVVHGSNKTLPGEILERYDQITLTLIQLIYNFIDLK